MTKLTTVAILATLATIAVIPAAAYASETTVQVRESGTATPAGSLAITTGKMIYAADGKRIGQVYRVTASGDAQLIISSRLVTVPAATLSDANGKLTTSLSKSELNRR